MKAEPGEIGREARLGAGDAEVGRDRKTQTATNGGALDGSDDRLLVAEDTHGLNVEMVDRAKIVGRIALAFLLALFLLLARRITEIGAGTKCSALRGKHGAADFDIAIEFFQRVGDLVDQGNVEEVQRRAPDFDQADMAMLFDTNIFTVAHMVLP